MKSKPSIAKVLFIAFLIAVEYLYSIYGVDFGGGYGSLVVAIVIYAFVIVVFVIAILYCYLIVLLEKKNFLAPHFFFRFAIPFLVMCIGNWIFLNFNRTYFHSYQQYTFDEYINQLSYSSDFIKVIGIMFFTVAIFLSVQKRIN